MADAVSGAPAPSSSSATAAAATPSAGEGGSQQGRGGGRGGRGGKGGGREGRGRGGGRRGGRGPAVAAAGPSDAGGDAAAGPAERGRGRGGAGGGGGKRGGGGRGGGGGGGGGRGRGGRGGRGGGRGARAEGGKAPVDAVAAALAGSLTLEEPGAHGGHGHDHDHHDCCIVCTEPLDGGRHRPAAGSCEHRETCALCFMRLRLLVKDMSCPVCKAELENVFVFESPQDTRPYAALHIWGTEAGPGVVYDDRAQLFMPKAFHEGVFKPIQAPNCPVPGCGTQCRSLGALKDHLRSAHEKRGFCDVCLDHKKVFVGEQQLYSKGELQRHIDKGEPSQGFLGHPACRFCKGKRVYDMGELYKHLREEHWACTICQRDRGIQHTYYRDYPELERHFRKEHHLCEDAACLAQRFVVFGHPLDLHSHIVNAHPERAQASRRRLELDVNAFRIRGQQGGGGDAQAEQEGGDGGAQAGGAGGGGWNVTGAPAVSAASHPEAFPELSAAATQAGLARAPSGGGVSRQQAFPPLSGAANGGGQQRRAPPPAATQRPTALAAARALIQPMPPVVTRQAGTGAWGSSGGRVPATVAASQALRQQLSSSSSSDGGAVAGAGGGGADDGVVHRNRRFAEALGITGGIEGQAAALLAASSTSTASSTEQAADAFRLDLERPVYPRELLAWASNPATKLEVQRLEERVAAFLGDRKEASLYLKPMPREERRRVHLLAEFYGLQSVSYDNDPKRFVALIKAPGTKPAVPVITLSQTAAAEHAAALHARATGHAVGGILRPPPGSGMLNATAKPPAPAPSPYAPSTPGAAATVVVTHLGEQSGKAVTDRLRQLLPGLPLCGYRREAPPGAPQDADRSREILVVELSSGEAAAALLERAARRPDALHPFQLRAGVGAVAAATAAAAASASAGGVEGAGVAPSRPPPTAAAPPPPVEGGSGSGEGAGGGGGRGRWGWGQSVLAGRLKPRTLPLPPSPATTELRPTLFSAMMEQQQQQQRKKGGAGAPKISKARKGPVAGAGVNTRLAAEEELRTGQVVRSNRWEGLLSDDEEEEEEEGTGAEAAGGEAGVEKGEEGQRADSEQADAGADADASARVASAASSEHGDGDGEAEEEEEEEEDGWEDEEEEDEDMEVECGRCTYKYLSADYCPMCQAPRK